jgi:hypothetical protein
VGGDKFEHRKPDDGKGLHSCAVHGVFAGLWMDKVGYFDFHHPMLRNSEVAGSGCFFLFPKKIDYPNIGYWIFLPLFFLVYVIKWAYENQFRCRKKG